MGIWFGVNVNRVEHMCVYTYVTSCVRAFALQPHTLIPVQLVDIIAFITDPEMMELRTKVVVEWKAMLVAHTSWCSKIKNKSSARRTPLEPKAKT